LRGNNAQRKQKRELGAHEKPDQAADAGSMVVDGCYSSHFSHKYPFSR
jgi:hypothetical protein